MDGINLEEVMANLGSKSHKNPFPKRPIPKRVEVKQEILAESNTNGNVSKLGSRVIRLRLTVEQEDWLQEQMINAIRANHKQTSTTEIIRAAIDGYRQKM